MNHTRIFLVKSEIGLENAVVVATANPWRLIL